MHKCAQARVTARCETLCLPVLRLQTAYHEHKELFTRPSFSGKRAAGWQLRRMRDGVVMCVVVEGACIGVRRLWLRRGRAGKIEALPERTRITTRTTALSLQLSHTVRPSNIDSSRIGALVRLIPYCHHHLSSRTRILSAIQVQFSTVAPLPSSRRPMRHLPAHCLNEQQLVQENESCLVNESSVFRWPTVSDIDPIRSAEQCRGSLQWYPNPCFSAASAPPHRLSCIPSPKPILAFVLPPRSCVFGC